MKRKKKEFTRVGVLDLVNKCIWGSGESIELALKDAAQFIDDTSQCTGDPVLVCIRLTKKQAESLDNLGGGNLKDLGINIKKCVLAE